MRIYETLACRRVLEWAAPILVGLRNNLHYEGSAVQKERLKICDSV